MINLYFTVKLWNNYMQKQVQLIFITNKIKNSEKTVKIINISDVPSAAKNPLPPPSQDVLDFGKRISCYMLTPLTTN